MKLPEGIGFTADQLRQIIQEAIFTNDSEWGAKTLAERMNELLPALFESWVRAEGVKVFGVSERPYQWTSYEVSLQLNGGSTHQAYLMLCEEIKKCEHFPGQTECMWCKKKTCESLLSEIKGRLAKATSDVLTVKRYHPVDVAPNAPSMLLDERGLIIADKIYDGDVPLFLHARTDLATLVAMVERAREALVCERGCPGDSNNQCFTCKTLAELDRLASEWAK